jgi:hypothetical protein
MAGNLYIAVDFGAPNAHDDGTVRPFTEIHYWENASIFLDPPRPSNTQAEVGKPSTIKVRVSNRGTVPAPGVKVQAWVMNPQVGLINVSSAVASFSSGIKTVDPGSGANTATDPHVFSCLRSGQPWTPTPGQLTTNGGHLCVVANCFQDPLEVEQPEGKEIGPTGKFDAQIDPHQGQRNIMVMPATKAMLAAPLMLTFDLMAPPAEVEEQVFLDLQTLTDEQFFDAGALNTLPSLPGVIVNERGQFMVGERELHPLRISPEQVEIGLTIPGLGEFEGTGKVNGGNGSVDSGFGRIALPDDLGFPGRIDVPDGIDLPGGGFGDLGEIVAFRRRSGAYGGSASGVSGDVGLPEDELVPVDNDRVGLTPTSLSLDISPDEPVGSAHGYDIVQHTESGETVGSGLRVVVVVVE